MGKRTDKWPIGVADRTVSERKKGPDQQEDGQKARISKRDSLTGTTRRVYRYIHRRGPVRLHDIERDLGLSSSSVADYHVQKLLGMKLIREENENGRDGLGYVAEEAVFEAMIRIRRTVIPIWITVTSFFAAGLIVLVTILRPADVSSTYLFSLVMVIVALSISAYETIGSFRTDTI
jgi:predicted DNA-binding transcriptional regulator